MKRFKKIYIEISNVCNLSCDFCPEGVRDKKFMEPELFKKVAQAVVPLTDEVCFHLMGEPLLHPKFEAYVKVCQSLGLRINLTTNGLLLTHQRMPALLNPAVKQINFSLQSFEANFPNKDNTRYLQKIFDFTERAIQERPDLYINYRLWNQGTAGSKGSNDRLLKQIRQGLHVDGVAGSKFGWKKGVKIKGQVYMHFDTRFEWPHPSHPLRKTQGFCHGLSSHIGILADGTVVPCCLDKEGVINLGNCGSQSISAIIQTPRAKSIYKGFQKGILVEDLCQKCTFIARFDHKLEHRDRRKGVKTTRGDLEN